MSHWFGASAPAVQPVPTTQDLFVPAQTPIPASNPGTETRVPSFLGAAMAPPPTAQNTGGAKLLGQ